MENIQDLRNNIRNGETNNHVKKTWITPGITEIPKFVILGGPTTKLTESSTDYFSF